MGHLLLENKPAGLTIDRFLHKKNISEGNRLLQMLVTEYNLCPLCLISLVMFGFDSGVVFLR